MRTRIRLLLPLLVAVSAAAIAVSPVDVPLRNWAAPPYFMLPPATPADGARRTEQIASGPSPVYFHAVTPCRIIDTRGNGFTGAYGPPHLTAGAVRSFAVTSPGTSCGIPSGVAAVSFNFAVVTLTAAGNLIVYPTGGTVPTVSSLNWTPVEGAISNAGVIRLASDSISVVVNGPVGSTVDLVVDVNGYYSVDTRLNFLNGRSGGVTLAMGNDIVINPAAGNSLNIGISAFPGNFSNTVVQRDASGNFDAGTITASLTGAASGSVLKTGDTMTGTLAVPNLVLATDPSISTSGMLRKNTVPFLHDTGDPSNVFVGTGAGKTTVTGGRNTGVGAYSAAELGTGSYDAFLGFQAGTNRTTGATDTAIGYGALAVDGPSASTLIGSGACQVCTGAGNTAVGAITMSNIPGNGSVAIGYGAGISNNTGSNCVYLGNFGSNETNQLHVGNPGGHTSAYMAGIFGATAASAIPVLVGTNGNGALLGTTTSSERFKEDVRDLDDSRDVIRRLRPVRFRYRSDLDPDGLTQYGLIAEEVETVDPGLVVCGEDGQPEAVRYHFLVPMILNEVQKDRSRLDDIEARLARLESRVR